MRRAIIATAGTAAAVAALLSYKSSNAIKASPVTVNIGPPASSSASSSTTPSSATTSSGSPSTTAPSATAPSRQFTGTDVQYNYGEIQLRVTTQGGKITRIDVVRQAAPDRQSQTINTQAIPILSREALAAQGVHIDVVSGATFTSQAFAQALQSALDQAGQ
jgi:uncharacterized protein with FMN-binding domain